MSNQLELETVLIEHKEEYLSFLGRRLGSEADAQDVLQDAYLKIKRMKNEDEISMPKAYLFRILSNLAYDRLKKNALHNSRYVGTDQEALDYPDTAADVEKVVYYREEIRVLQAALNELSYKCRMAFVLHRTRKNTYEEVGAKLGVSESMAKKYVYKALAHCRAYMLERGEGDA